MDKMSSRHFGSPWPEAGQRTNAAIRRRNGDGSAFRGERVQQVEISYNCVGVIELPGINKTA
ncbi:MAG: hypothetical protein ACLRJC_13245 [Emergencia timonensis]|uniref:hypothetical protein n=1 Tax=Emergencia timonensis TaxID=1776384 RepID=UPI0011DDEA3B|nr:hypothetical protein [Emergencia timonensis]WNX88703.1 hypothetical protein RVY71_00195 [Emergencia timonensis]